MRRTGPSSSGLLRRGRWTGVAASLGALLAASAHPTTAGLSGPPAAPDEPLPMALAAGRVRAEDLRGREVYAFDETRVGTLVAAADAAVFALDPRLGLGHNCIAAPLGRVRVAAAERRLVLDMTPREFQAALAVRIACGV